MGLSFRDMGKSIYAGLSRLAEPIFGMTLFKSRHKTSKSLANVFNTSLSNSSNRTIYVTASGEENIRYKFSAVDALQFCMESVFQGRMGQRYHLTALQMGKILP